MFIRTMFLILLACASISNAASLSPSKNGTMEKAQIVVLTEMTSELKQENKVLRAQITLMKEYQEQQSETVRWSIGLVLGLFTVIVGLNWWTNDKQLKEKLDDIQTKQAQSIQNLDVKLGSRIDEKALEAQRELDEKSAVVMEAISSEISKITADLNNEKEIRGKSAELINQIIDRRAKIVDGLESSLRRVEADMWERKGMLPISLYATLEAVVAADSGGFPSSVELHFKEAERIIKQLIAAEKSNINEDDKKYFEKQLAKISSKYGKEIAATKVLIEQIKI